MVTVEVVMRMKIILVGPFDTQRQALYWASDLIEANPEEKALITVNHKAPHSIRIYMGEAEDQLQDELNSGLGFIPE